MKKIEVFKEENQGGGIRKGSGGEHEPMILFTYEYALILTMFSNLYLVFFKDCI